MIDLHIIISELKFLTNCGIKDAILDILEFRYNMKMGNNRNSKYVMIDDINDELNVKAIKCSNNSNLHI